MLHSQGQKQPDSCVSRIYLFFWAIFLFFRWHLLFILSVHSLEVVFTKLCFVFFLTLQIFLNCFSLNHNLPFSTTNDGFPSDLLLLWTLVYSTAEILRCSLLDLFSFCWLHGFKFLSPCPPPFLYSCSCLSLALYFSILVCPCLSVHVDCLSLCHLWQKKMPLRKLPIYYGVIPETQLPDETQLKYVSGLRISDIVKDISRGCSLVPISRLLFSSDSFYPLPKFYSIAFLLLLSVSPSPALPSQISLSLCFLFSTGSCCVICKISFVYLFLKTFFCLWVLFPSL